MSRPTVAEIDLQAFANNWKVLTQIQKADRLIPVIKANAYGHGSVVLAQELQRLGAKQVAVALVEEAEVVRKAGFSGQILILGPFAKEGILLARQLNCTPIIGDKQNLLNLVAGGFSGPVHVKWDTGMNRLGLVEDDVDWLKEQLQKNPQLKVQAFCTHFLRGEDLGQDLGYCGQQLARFQKIESAFPEVSEKHVLNTDAFFANAQHRKLADSYGARPGLSLYGYTSVINEWSKKLQPVMTLKTKIVHFIKVKAGQSVSYNASWMAQRDSVIAVLPIGYADGYPRSLSNKGQVFVREQTVPLVGIVCMDYLMIDVTDVPAVQLDDEVELWGKNLPLTHLAQIAGTITYELMTALTSRVPRKIVSN